MNSAGTVDALFVTAVNNLLHNTDVNRYHLKREYEYWQFLPYLHMCCCPSRNYSRRSKVLSHLDF